MNTISSPLEYNKAFAILAELDQNTRKIRKIPSITHPIAVSSKLYALNENDLELQISSLYHDTLEDDILSEEKLFKLFGEKVFRIVYSLSDQKHLCLDRHATWALRKKNKLEKLQKVDSVSVLLIAAADICDNMQAIILDDIHLHGRVFDALGGSREQQRRYFDEAGKILLARSSDLNSKSLKILALEILCKAQTFFG